MDRNEKGSLVRSVYESQAVDHSNAHYFESDVSVCVCVCVNFCVYVCIYVFMHTCVCAYVC